MEGQSARRVHLARERESVCACVNVVVEYGVEEGERFRRCAVFTARCADYTIYGLIDKLYCALFISCLRWLI